MFVEFLSFLINFHHYTMKKLAIFFLHARKKFSIPLASRLARLHLWWWGASVGRNLRVKGHLVMTPKGKLVIGNNVMINSGPIHVGGSGRRTSFRIAPQGTLTIKDGVGMSNTSILCFHSITIEAEAMIGGGCEILDGDGHALDDASQNNGNQVGKCGAIVIGEKAFIGGCSIILKGVTVGEGAIVGMGSVVTKSIPPYEVWGGAPARFIKKIERASGE